MTYRDILGQWDMAFRSIRLYDFKYMGHDWDKPGLLVEEVAGEIFFFQNLSNRHKIKT